MKNVVNEVEVSVVIICMNNLSNLLPCLDSIFINTKKYNIEIIVIAYLFSIENLELLQLRFPNVKVIESDEIRGFSENNNLAFHLVKGKYCFFLNDDTIMEMPVIDLLVESFEKEPNASFMSPKTVFADGSLQSCGRPKINIWTYFLSALKLWNEQKVNSKFINQKGIFQTYNIVGAAFMVKTDIFEKLGLFDEAYFFCPEDIALSTLANKKGYKCFVNELVTIVHLEGGTASHIQTATQPAIYKGMILFLGSNFFKKIIITVIVFLEIVIKWIYSLLNHSLKNRKFNLNIFSNSFEAIFSNKSTKEIFIQYYNKIK